MTVEIIQGHCLDVLKAMPDESAHCCVTSPPYWGLRDYGIEPQVWGGDSECEHVWGDEGTRRNGRDWDPTTGKSKVTRDYHGSTGQFCQLCSAWRGSLGLEPTPELYVEHIVTIFREVRRVLRGDGTLWLNLGDCYASGGNPGPMSDKGTLKGGKRQEVKYKQYTLGRAPTPNGLKPKDLIGIPHMAAFALRADGWYLRSDIIWSKPNGMPESVKDRPSNFHEHLFLLSKSQRYFYDADAIKEPHGYNRWSNRRTQDAAVLDACYAGQAGKSSILRDGKINPFPEGGRNKRSVWALSREDWLDHCGELYDLAMEHPDVWNVNTQPFSGAHFAVFPGKLIEPCIKAGCPVRVCAKCGAPYQVTYQRTVKPPPDRINNNPFAHDPMVSHGEGASTLRHVVEREAGEETPGCDCNAGAMPGTVLDPFGGSGTTGKIAESLGRNSVLIELGPQYCEMAAHRTAQQSLFTQKIAS